MSETLLQQPVEAITEPTSDEMRAYIERGITAVGHYSEVMYLQQSGEASAELSAFMLERISVESNASDILVAYRQFNGWSHDDGGEFLDAMYAFVQEKSATLEIVDPSTEVEMVQVPQSLPVARPFIKFDSQPNLLQKVTSFLAVSAVSISGFAIPSAITREFINNHSNSERVVALPNQLNLPKLIRAQQPGDSIKQVEHLSDDQQLALWVQNLELKKAAMTPLSIKTPATADMTATVTKMASELVEIHQADIAPQNRSLVDSMVSLVGLVADHPDLFTAQELKVFAAAQGALETTMQKRLASFDLFADGFSEEQAQAVIGLLTKITYTATTTEQHDQLIAAYQAEQKAEHDAAKHPAKTDKPDKPAHDAHAAAPEQLHNGRKIPSESVNLAAIGSIGQVPGGSIRQVVKHMMDDYGMPYRSAAFLAGSYITESGLNPKAIGDHGLAEGLAQWHAGRRVHGLPPTLLGQENYSFAEIHNSYHKVYAILMNPNATDEQLHHAIKLYEGYGVEGGRTVYAHQIIRWLDTPQHNDHASGQLAKPVHPPHEHQQQASPEIPAAPAGTIDLGIHEGFVPVGAHGSEYASLNIRLVAIPGFKSSGEESNPDSAWYIKGSDGLVIVNAEIAPYYLALFQEALDQGIVLTAKSSFRSMAHQEFLANRNHDRNAVGNPGRSTHQAGLAVDLDLGSDFPLIASHYKNKQGGRPNKHSPAVAPKSSTWRWMVANGQRFKLTQFWNEPWHWQLIPNLPQYRQNSQVE